MSERVTQACLIQLDPTTMVGFLNLRWIPDVPLKPLLLLLPSLFDFKRLEAWSRDPRACVDV